MSRSIHDLPPMERLAIEQALYQRIAEDVSTKNADSLRSACDEQIINNYRAMGAKSYDTHVNGQKVGTYSVRMSKEKPEQVQKQLIVTNPEELNTYVQSDECKEELTEYINLMAQNFAEYLLDTYGIVAEGCEVVDEVTPAQSTQVIGTTLRIDADKVAKALSGYLPTVIGGLIDAGQ